MSAIAALAIPLVGCNSDSPMYEFTRDFNTVNLFTPRNTSEPVFANECVYYCHFVEKETAQASSSVLMYQGQTHSLSIPAVKVENKFYADGDYAKFSSPSGSIDGGQTQVSNFDCVISGLFYPIPSKVPGVAGVTAYTSPFFIAQYNIGTMYSVATFQKDATYAGTTSTVFDYQGQSQAYESTLGRYRVIIDPLSKKADVVLYNVKFAEPSPQLILVLKNLDFKLERGGYSITGADVVPGQPDGNMLTPNENFPFETFSLKTASSDLTKIQIEYTVRNKGMETQLNNGQKIYYKGSFTGRYVFDPDDPFYPAQ